tara:strand:+ start:393 stop:620 length:228 start_codon:yes stop_codon:yes gene_type:complete
MSLEKKRKILRKRLEMLREIDTDVEETGDLESDIRRELSLSVALLTGYHIWQMQSDFEKNGPYKGPRIKWWVRKE